jgi:hypothetical protein
MLTSEAKPTSKPRSVEQIEQEIVDFYRESLQTGNNVHDAVALTAIKFDMHWATIKMVVGA